jgi:hypothetical protein
VDDVGTTTGERLARPGSSKNPGYLRNSSGISRPPSPAHRLLFLWLGRKRLRNRQSIHIDIRAAEAELPASMPVAPIGSHSSAELPAHAQMPASSGRASDLRRDGNENRSDYDRPAETASHRISSPVLGERVRTLASSPGPEEPRHALEGDYKDRAREAPGPPRRQL